MQCCHYGEAARDEAWRGVSRLRDGTVTLTTGSVTIWADREEKYLTVPSEPLTSITASSGWLTSWPASCSQSICRANGYRCDELRSSLVCAHCGNEGRILVTIFI